MLNVVIDLSHHNTVSSFSTIKADGIEGIIHKATQGLSYTDPTYASRKTQALDAGLMWGAYHFASAADGQQQAEYFLSVVKPGPGDLLVLDIEQNYDSQGKPAASMSIADAEAFVTYVQSQTGRWPGLYSGSYIKELLGSSQNATLANCWFWLAQYGSTAVVPANWSTWTMWQYTDGVNGPTPHSVNGVGNCDRDKFNGDDAGLHRLWNVSQA
ncbi:MAG TPA: glycoside hydrolase family 25 protein [Candidatus Kapabacteria bacterium]|nr:glycoside hydrolase family 25 protein [Candidatus Kapabacteria bacterium]